MLALVHPSLNADRVLDECDSLKIRQQPAKSQAVSLNTQAGYLSCTDWCQIRKVSEGLSCMDVTDVHLHDREINSRDGIP